MPGKKAIIIGGGPAGLTAAYELLTRSDVKPIVLEKSTYMGGISRTVNYKGNRIDIGGHRFFSKSDRVMQWWLKQMPMDETAKAGTVITYQNQQRATSRQCAEGVQSRRCHACCATVSRASISCASSSNTQFS